VDDVVRELPVDLVRRRVEEDGLGRQSPGSVEHIERPDDVRLEVVARSLNRCGHRYLTGEMEYRVEGAVLSEHAIDGGGGSHGGRPSDDGGDRVGPFFRREASGDLARA